MRRPLLISHDLSYSGAPIALLSLAKSLKRLAENPIVVSLSDGPLRSHFLEAGIELAGKVDPAGVAFVIANTVVSVPAALQFKRFGVPVAAWLHESMYFFRSLGIAPDDCGLQNLDIVLAPSRFQLDELEQFLPKGNSCQLRNMVEQKWFRPSGEEPVFAVTGQWERRKGQYDLLRLVRDAGVNCAFKYIGADRPHRDPENLIGPQHKFLGPVRPEVSGLEIAKSDAIVSCAEAEVQPLSVIEALMAGRPALLSDIPAHRVLADLIPNVFLFDRSSHQSFKEGLEKLAVAVPDQDVARQASRAARSLFGEAAFDERLKGILQIIRQRKPLDATISTFQDV